MHGTRCGIRRWVAPAMLVLAAAGSAYPFVPIPPGGSIQTTSRWSAIGHASTGGKGLHDGLSVFVSPGFAAALVSATLGTVTAEDVADTEDAIRAAFAGWESSVLAFDVAFEAPAIRGEGAGADIDLFVVAPSDPVFFGSGALFGITYFTSPFEPSRLLTNGTTLGGLAISGADIFFKTDLIPAFAPLFPTREDKLHALQRLVMHEVGHALGLHHPNEFAPLNLDTNTDPLDRMAIDPTAPFAGLLTGTPIDGDAVMTNFPTSIPGALVLTALRNDDRGGRDVLYPAPTTLVCPPIPRTHCRTAARSALTIKTVPGVPAKTRLLWKWSKGAATTLAELGDPLTTRITGLCVYSDAPARLLALRVPSDALRWKAKGTTGFAYADRPRSADGVKRSVLKSGAAGRSSVAIVAGGVTMPVPALGALPAPITVQLVDHNSAVCLETVFAADDLTANTATKLKAKRTAL